MYEHFNNVNISFWKLFDETASSYFGILTSILTHVQCSKYESMEYANIVKSVMNKNELCLTFYYCLLEDSWKLRELVEKLRILEKMPTGNTTYTRFRDRLDPNAFGESHFSLK